MEISSQLLSLGCRRSWGRIREQVTLPLLSQRIHGKLPAMEDPALKIFYINALKGSSLKSSGGNCPSLVINHRKYVKYKENTLLTKKKQERKQARKKDRQKERKKLQVRGNRRAMRGEKVSLLDFIFHYLLLRHRVVRRRIVTYILVKLSSLPIGWYLPISQVPH